MSELVHEGVETVRRTGKAPGKKSLPYVYYAKQYDVARVSASVETHATYGGVDYPRLLRASFEIRAHGEPWTEKFTLVCGIDGPAAERAGVRHLPAALVARHRVGARRQGEILTGLRLTPHESFGSGRISLSAM